MHVIFLHGPAASGKHTVGTLVAGALGLPLFHNHLAVDLVATLFDFGSPEFVELRQQTWLRSFALAARAGRSFVFTFHPEASVPDDFVPLAQAAVEEHGGRIHFVELVCDEAEVEKRLGNESRRAFGKLTDLDFYRQLRSSGAFDHPALPAPLLKVDTGSLDPTDAADRIVDAIRGVEAGAI